MTTTYRDTDPDADVAAWSLERVRELTLAALAGTGADAYLFGSRARGNARPMSDIDIAIDTHGRPAPEDLLAQLREALEESTVPYTVDLVDLVGASECLRHEVQTEGILWTA